MNELTCAAARALLLDADPEVLRARGDAPLERHLRTCAACAAVAQHILREQQLLADALVSLSQSGAEADVPQAARAVASRPDSAQTEAVLTSRARSRWFAIAAPLTAAAALLLVLWQNDSASQPLQPILLAPPYVPEVAVVNTAAGSNVAVMRTSNPDITIVWQLPTVRTP